MSRLSSRLCWALFSAMLPTAVLAQGVTATTITLGQSAALTGNAAALGIEMKLGAEAYFESVNKKGGVNGRMIKLVTLDDGYEPERAKANTQKLIQEQDVLALFGYVGTPTSAASMPVFTAAKVPFIGAFTGANSLREPFNRYIFNVRASYFDETEAIVEHLTRLGIKRTAVFYQNDGYGQAGLEGVERAMKKRNLAITGKATVERNSVDVTAAVAALAKTDSQAVVIITAYKSSAAFTRAMKSAGAGAQFWNVSFVGSKALSDELKADGRGVQISQVVPFPWSGGLPILREYQSLVPADKISFTTLEGFIAAKVMVAGLRAAGPKPDREKLVDGLAKLGTQDFGGFKVSFSPTNHNASSYVDLTIIAKDGQFKH